MKTKNTILAILLSSLLASCGSDNSVSGGGTRTDSNENPNDVTGPVQQFASAPTDGLDLADQRADKLVEISFNNNDFMMKASFETLLNIHFETKLIDDTILVIDEFVAQPGDQQINNCPVTGTETITMIDQGTKDVAEKNDAIGIVYSNCDTGNVKISGSLGARLHERNAEKISIIERLANFKDEAGQISDDNTARFDKTKFADGSVFVKTYENFARVVKVNQDSATLKFEFESTNTPASGENEDLTVEGVAYGSLFDQANQVREIGYGLKANGEGLNRVRFDEQGAPFAGDISIVAKSNSGLIYSFQPGRILVTFIPAIGNRVTCLFSQENILNGTAKFNQDGTCSNQVDTNEPPPNTENPITQFLGTLPAPFSGLSGLLNTENPAIGLQDLQSGAQSLLTNNPLPLGQVTP